MRIINKKIDTEFFEEVCDGIKTFELRKDEDKIEVGDYICLHETELCFKISCGDIHEPRKVNNYTGKSCLVKVIYILKDYDGLKKGYAIYGIKKIKLVED